MTWYDMVSQLQACRGPINTWAKRQTLRPLPAYDMLLKQSGMTYQGNQAGEKVVGRRWPHDELDGGQQAQLHVQHVLHTACNATGVWEGQIKLKIFCRELGIVSYAGREMRGPACMVILA